MNCQDCPWKSTEACRECYPETREALRLRVAQVKGRGKLRLVRRTAR